MWLLIKKMIEWFVIQPEDRLRGPEFIESSYVPEEIELSKDELILHMLNAKDVSEPEITNPNGKKTLLILNDLNPIEKILRLDFEDMVSDGYAIYDDYRIVRCNGKFANLAAYKYITEHNVDVAILEVMTNSNILTDSRHFLEFNGLDVAEELRKKNENAQIAIMTTLPLESGKIYGEKFKKLVDEKAINKFIKLVSDSRKDEIEGMLYNTAR